MAKYVGEELYLKYRPKSLDEVVGQESAVAIIKKFHKTNKIPHAILFSGPSGTGKTTLARITAKLVGCNEEVGLKEINSSDFRGVDSIREIRSVMNITPLQGSSRVWILDEFHNLLKLAQDAFLKMLEEAPRHVYFMMATTDPAKLQATIRSRCTDIKLKSIPDHQITDLVKRVLKAEKKSKKVSEEVIEKLVDASGGCARKALVTLNALINIKGEDNQLEVISNADSDKEAYSIFQALMYSRAKWPDMCKLIQDTSANEPESIRRLVLACASTVALKGGANAKRATDIIHHFSKNYFDTGKAGLVLSCYDACMAQNK